MPRLTWHSKVAHLAPEVANEQLLRCLEAVQTTIDSSWPRSLDPTLVQSAKTIVESGESLYAESIGAQSTLGRPAHGREDPRITTWMDQITELALDDTSSGSTAIVAGTDAQRSTSYENKRPLASMSSDTTGGVHLSALDVNDPETGGDWEDCSAAGSHDSELDLTRDAAAAALANGVEAFDAQEWITAETDLREALNLTSELPARLRPLQDLAVLRYKLAICAFHVHDTDHRRGIPLNGASC